MADDRRVSRQMKVAQAFNCDRITAEVVSAMDAAGIPNLVLKGPSIANWLYPSGGRTYADTDLLVPSKEFGRASQVLVSLGFSEKFEGVRPIERLLLPTEETGFVRRVASNSAPLGKVDLHHNLPHLPTPEGSLWEAFRTESSPIEVNGVEVRTLGRTALTLHIVLHAAQHGFKFHTDEDLRRVIEVLSIDEWRPVADLAEQLGIADILGYGLRRHQDGAQIADLLGLPNISEAESPYWRASSPRGSERLTEFLATSNWWTRIKWIGQTLVPSPTWVRHKCHLPNARGVALLRGYGRLWWGIATTSVPTVRYVIAGRHRAARPESRPHE
jgi:Uncharacterised nucleotidyltransferase